MTFDKLGLSEPLLRAVREKGYTEPTVIQNKCIPIILEGKDIMGGAQTGTGKTAGFTLPLLQNLILSATFQKNRPVRCLILTPTRELAAQVSKSVEVYGKYVPLTSTCVFGGVAIGPQVTALRKGVDILIATPGRLLDHVQQRNVDLSKVEIFVLDEADRMLDMGFLPDIKRVLHLIPEKRQNLLFSATFSDEIQRLSRSLLNSPVYVQAAPGKPTADLVTQVIHPVDRHAKSALLAHLVGGNNWKQVLVFTRTKHGANKLSQYLHREGITSSALHGNKSQSARTAALADFKTGRVRVLCATDIAARGLDIEQLPHVVNYELPHVPEDYVHRIGRTGRAGNEGEAMSLVCVDELKLLKNIEKLIGRTLPRTMIPGFEWDESVTPEPILVGGGNRGNNARRGRDDNNNRNNNNNSGGGGGGRQNSRGGRDGSRKRQFAGSGDASPRGEMSSERTHFDENRGGRRDGGSSSFSRGGRGSSDRRGGRGRGSGDFPSPRSGPSAFGAVPSASSSMPSSSEGGRGGSDVRPRRSDRGGDRGGGYRGGERGDRGGGYRGGERGGNRGGAGRGGRSSAPRERRGGYRGGNE